MSFALLRKSAHILCAVALIRHTQGQCTAPQIQVYQNVTGSLGSVQAVATAQTVEEFYGYQGASFTGPLPVGGDTSLITIHQNSNTCELGLVVVNSKAGEGADFAYIRMYFNGDVTSAPVKDDPAYSDIVYHDDSYDDLFSRRPGFSKIDWTWRKEDTDGMAQRIVPDWVGCIQVMPLFNPPTNTALGFEYGTLTEWKYVSAGDSTVDLALDQNLSICFGGASPSNPGKDPFPKTEFKEGNCDILGGSEYPVCGRCERPLFVHHWIGNIWQKLVCWLHLPLPLQPFGPTEG